MRLVHFIRFGFGSFIPSSRRVASRSSGVRRDRSYVTYRLDLRVVVVLIAVDPATKVEVFADVANISSVSCVYLAWRVVPNDDDRRTTASSRGRWCDLVVCRRGVGVSEYYCE